MPRHYKPISRAKRDAISDARVARLEAQGVPVRQGPPPREPAELLLRADGQVFLVRGEPAGRQGQYRLTVNGEDIGVGGLEAAWREVQRRKARVPGQRSDFWWAT